MVQKRKRIMWTDLELNGLLEDEECCVYWETIKKHMTLHPFQLKNKTLALNEMLTTSLNFYDPILKGFALLYQNPKLITDVGEHLNDNHLIHIDIEAQYYIFRPEVGKILKGIVNKKGINHLRVLVHKAFSVSIQKPQNDHEWIGEKISIGQEIKFTITFLDFDNKFPVIKGTLDSENYTQGCKIFEMNDEIEEDIDQKSQIRIIMNTNKNIFDTNQENSNASNYESESEINKDSLKTESVSSPKKKKKFKEDISESLLTQNKELSKKKSKKKCKNTEEDIEDEKVLEYMPQIVDEHLGEMEKKYKKQLQEKLFNSATDKLIKQSFLQNDDPTNKKLKKSKSFKENAIHEESSQQLDLQISHDYHNETQKNYKKQLKNKLFSSTTTDKIIEQPSHDHESTKKKSKKKSKNTEQNTENNVFEQLSSETFDEYHSETEKAYKKRLQDKLFNSTIIDEINDKPSNEHKLTKKKLKKKSKNTEQNTENNVFEQLSSQTSAEYHSETEKTYKKRLQEKLFSSATTNKITEQSSYDHESTKKKSKKKSKNTEQNTENNVFEQLNSQTSVEHLSETEKNDKKRLQEKLFSTTIDKITQPLMQDDEIIKKKSNKLENLKKNKRNEKLSQQFCLRTSDEDNSETEKNYKKRLHEKLFNYNSITELSKSKLIESDESNIKILNKKERSQENIQDNQNDNTVVCYNSDESSFSDNKEKLKKYKNALRKSLGIPDNVEESHAESPKKNQKRKIQDNFDDIIVNKVHIDKDRQPIFLTPKIENAKKQKKKTQKNRC